MLNKDKADFLPLYDIGDEVQSFDNVFCSNSATIHILDSEESDHSETEGISTGPINFDRSQFSGTKSPSLEMEYDSDYSTWPHPDRYVRDPGDDGCQVFVDNDFGEDLFSTEDFSDVEKSVMDLRPVGHVPDGEERLHQPSGTPDTAHPLEDLE